MGLEVIREATIEQLRDPEWLEHAIYELGIYPAEEIPACWWTENGGIGICQYPNQFAPYLIHLSHLEIRRYAEIGLWVGGTFSTTVEYLQRFGLQNALGIDRDVQDRVRAYAEANPNVSLLEAPSTTSEAAKALRAFKPDLILVDGDHTEKGCRADWKLAKSIAPWVAVHDIVGEGYPGVVKVWKSIAGEKQEWTEQHPAQPLSQNGLGLVKTA